jgi:hypothetical protein
MEGRKLSWIERKVADATNPMFRAARSLRAKHRYAHRKAMMAPVELMAFDSRLAERQLKSLVQR